MSTVCLSSLKSLLAITLSCVCYYLVYMIARLIDFHNAHSVQCILVKLECLKELLKLVTYQYVWDIDQS